MSLIILLNKRQKTQNISFWKFLCCRKQPFRHRRRLSASPSPSNQYRKYAKNSFLCFCTGTISLSLPASLFHIYHFCLDVYGRADDEHCLANKRPLNKIRSFYFPSFSQKPANQKKGRLVKLRPNVFLPGQKFTCFPLFLLLFFTRCTK